MQTEQKHLHTCPHCGNKIEEDRYVMRADGSFRCESCYFNDTYLEGVVHNIDTGYLVTLEAFVNAIDAREHEVGNHSLRVTEYSLIIANSCEVRGRDLIDLYCGALLHDIGKIGVPDAILLKQGPLNEEEQRIMRRHPQIGYHIIGRIGYFSRAAEIIHCHHEHYDGSGYPRGLKGDGIPPGARVFAVADALDALTVKRPYHEALLFEEALEEIIKSSGRVYDPSVIQAVLKVANELKDYIGRIVFSSMGNDA